MVPGAPGFIVLAVRTSSEGTGWGARSVCSWKPLRARSCTGTAGICERNSHGPRVFRRPLHLCWWPRRRTGFTNDGRSYAVALGGGEETPLPWANVIANRHFGTIVTASGSAFTWSGNSRENRLTAFANDPVADPTGEALFIRDEESGEYWSPTPGPVVRSGSDRYLVQHSAGLTQFSGTTSGVDHALDVFVDVDDPVKFSLLALTNSGSVPRTLSVFAYNEWVLGPPRDGEHLNVVTDFDQGT